MKKYRVISTQKQTALILNTENGNEMKCFLSRKHKPICGDYVSIQENKNEKVISKVHSHHNVFSRANHKGHKQHIAANVDNQVIVVAVKPEPTKDLINRYLIAANSCDMKPILVFNKVDICDQFFKEKYQLYTELGFETLFTSTKTHENLDQLKLLLEGKTSIFVGMSGVGKSSISEILLGNSIKTGAISEKTGKGSHVTSVTQLYKIPDSSGYLIDSPGVWEYGLWKMETDEIAAGFVEFDDYIGHCKFSNCTHVHEPKCAVKKALEESKITHERYDSYLRIIDSMKYWD